MQMLLSEPFMPYQHLLTIAQDAAKLAGEAVLEIYDSGDFTEYSKDDDSPVTSADYRANEIIMALLQQHTPDIPIMSEETEQLQLSDRAAWQRYWLIDPIDGTQEFIARSGDFAAVKGKGAFKSCAVENKQIHVKTFVDPANDPVVIAISRRQKRENVLKRLDQARTYQTLPAGSCSLKACFIAEGKADFFMRLGVTGEWDTGASQCIVSEAGGLIRSVDFEPMSYNQRESLENPNFVVLGDQSVDWAALVNYYID
jgi:3'(2'), 5'-bisphosphate nucleotidase